MPRRDNAAEIRGSNRDVNSAKRAGLGGKRSQAATDDMKSRFNRKLSRTWVSFMRIHYSVNAVENSSGVSFSPISPVATINKITIYLLSDGRESFFIIHSLNSFINIYIVVIVGLVDKWITGIDPLYAGFVLKESPICYILPSWQKGILVDKWLDKP
jgi:hypothetical protein